MNRTVVALLTPDKLRQRVDEHTVGFLEHPSGCIAHLLAKEESDFAALAGSGRSEGEELE